MAVIARRRWSPGRPKRSQPSRQRLSPRGFRCWPPWRPRDRRGGCKGVRGVESPFSVRKCFGPKVRAFQRFHDNALSPPSVLVLRKRRIGEIREAREFRLEGELYGAVGPWRCLAMITSAVPFTFPSASSTLRISDRTRRAVHVLHVIFLAEHEENHVGVLFDRARFTQVGELRPLVLALSHRRESCDNAMIGTLSSLPSALRRW